MGSKGSQTTTSQSGYTPNPLAYNAIAGALGNAQSVASQPFNLPVAPVAGFSPQQQQAFGLVGNAQGTAQPYINTAANYFNQSAQGPNISQFFNPYASAVTSQLQNIFGQQNVQNTGNLVQSAGGTGADRIAVGQANMANQQGLAAGQTLANLYAPSLNAAEQEQQLLQSAGFGMGALGPSAQTAALQGAQALLGTGGLQQQETQAQLNAPYQWQVAQQAYPFQTAQFLAGITGALAPGLGGTTQGQVTQPGPSLLSQILGGGMAGAGIFGGMGGFSGSSPYNPFGASPAYGGGNIFSGDAYGGSGANPLEGLTAADYGAGFRKGGRTFTARRNKDGSYSFADGGVISDPMLRMMELNQMEGGSNPFSAGALPTGVNATPDNIASGVVPKTQLTQIQPHIPSLPSAAPSQSGAGLGDIVGTGLKLATMFAKKGGRIDPKKFDGANPYAFADGGDTTIVPEQFSPAQAIDNRWVTSPMPANMYGVDPSIALNEARAYGMRSPYAPVPAPTVSADAEQPAPDLPVASSPTMGEVPPNMPTDQTASPYSPRQPGFIDSPWAALTAAGLGMMASRSPFAGVAIGQGGLEGLKTLQEQRAAAQKEETIGQAAQRLSQEAQFHQDQYTKMTPYQKGELEMRQEQLQRPFQIGVNPNTGFPLYAVHDPRAPNGIRVIDPASMTGTPNGVSAPPTSSVQPNNQAAALPSASTIASGEVPTNIRPEVLQSLDPQLASTVKALDEGRMQFPSGFALKSPYWQNILRLVSQYDPSFDAVNYNARSRTRNDFTSGKSAQNITSLNMTTGHLDTLDKAIDALGNTRFQWLNPALQAGKSAAGDTEFQAAKKNFDVAKQAVATELTRVFRGTGGNVHDIVEWEKSINDADSPAALHQSVKTAVDLLRSRIEAMGDTYNRGMGTTRDPLTLLSPHAAETIKRLSGQGISQTNIPDNAAAYLRQHPELREQFDQKYGVGAANSILGH